MDWSDWMYIVDSFEINSVPINWSKKFPALNNEIGQYLGDTEYIISLSRYELIVEGRTYHGIDDGTKPINLSAFYKIVEKETDNIYLAYKEFYELYYGVKCVSERNSEEMISNIKNKIEALLSRNKGITAGEILKEEVNPFLVQRLGYVRSFNPILNPTVEFIELKKVIEYFDKDFEWSPKNNVDSLVWNIRHENLISILYNKLSAEYIHPETNKDFFIKVFKGVKLSVFDKLEKRILWKSTIQDIIELILLLKNAELISEDGLNPSERRKNKIYKIVYSCFCKYNVHEDKLVSIAKGRGNNKLELLSKTDSQKELAKIVSSLKS